MAGSGAAIPVRRHPILRPPSSRILAATLVVAAAACGDGDTRRAGSDSTLTILYADPGDAFFLNPNRWHLAQFPVFLTLTTSNDLYGEGPQPRLAERWEHSVDYREWTIHLRQDLTWHDGAPVTAHDIEFTMALWRHPDVLYSSEPATVTVFDDHTLRIAYERPTLGPLNGWNVYYPKHLLQHLDPAEFAEWEYWKQPVGNGPYRVVRHVPRTLMELEANPDYCCGKPRIERVVLKFAGGTQVTELLSGNVDAAQISPAQLPAVMGNPRFDAHHYASGAVTVHLFWNHNNPLFAQADVRRALTMAIDRRELHGVLGLPEDLPIADGIHTARQYARGDLAPALPYDPEAAELLLDRAGWGQGRAGGVRLRDGREFRFTLIVPDAEWLASPWRAATFIQAQLRGVGIRMEIQQHEGTGSVHQRIDDGDFEAAITFLVAHLPLRHSAYFGEGSPTGYSPPRVTELLRAAQVTMDLAERDVIYRELAEIFHADVPVTFLYPNVENWVVNRRVRGLESPFRAHPLMHLAELWLEEVPH
ncbi:MAG TPA: ABC transporter substrate-binding protein [Gemmatimonadaceae bacterium]|nr:ABC transporter substrate-binding protein [Gemmatimonadaceae bacterium]